MVRKKVMTEGCKASHSGSDQATLREKSQETMEAQAYLSRRLDLCIAQKGGRFEHLREQHKLRNVVERPTATSVEDADEF